jgi:hypothetical protein
MITGRENPREFGVARPGKQHTKAFIGHSKISFMVQGNGL